MSIAENCARQQEICRKAIRPHQANLMRACNNTLPEKIFAAHAAIEKQRTRRSTNDHV
jgi:hypothetical protein